MLANRNPSKTVYDVVIIGAGAAGITLALELGREGVSVALVEGGDYNYSAQSQNLYQGFNQGIPYPFSTFRLRYFGGTTNHWSGWCRPLDAKDFIPRPSIQYPGWAISQADLEPYLSRALGIVDVPQPALWEPETDHKQPNFHPKLEHAGFKEIYWRWSLPTRFKEKFLSELHRQRHIKLSVNDSLIDFEFTDEGEITGAILQHIETGEQRTVYGKRFVMACGAIENARLLLHINAKHEVNFGNQSGQLGKNFMEHPHYFSVGQLIIFDPDYVQDTPTQNKGYRFFVPDQEIVEAEGILQPSIRFRMFEREQDRRYFIQLLTQATNFVEQDYWQVGNLDIVGEQLPIASNQITLSDETDALGIGKTILHWELQDIDYASLRKTLIRFARFIVEADLGRCKLESWVTDESRPKEPEGGGHHMGTTRMGETEQDGVVDRDCKVFGTKNLYVAGSSVFSTGGHTNPTLTILQLALRLADHLKHDLS